VVHLLRGREKFRGGRDDGKERAEEERSARCERNILKIGGFLMRAISTKLPCSKTTFQIYNQSMLDLKRRAYTLPLSNGERMGYFRNAFGDWYHFPFFSTVHQNFSDCTSYPPWLR
jgi:hypothetical protein